MSTNADEGLIRPGKNCWRACRADRFGWAIDGALYFEALRSSFEKAQHEILIVGWDIDSRVQLIRDDSHPHFPSPLCDTLQNLVADRPELCVRVLSWDFAMMYVLERELLPAYSFGWHDSERLHFHLDSAHATGASQHQKLVIIDGQVAFIGGIDLTKARWDRPEHARDDPGRQDPNGEVYGPFHDIQAVVSGKAASELRELIDFRWENATGRGLPTPEFDPEALDSRWPDEIDVQLENADVCLARTWVDPATGEATREVEALFRDMIAVSRQSIYIENQYFTSPAIAEALAERLEEEDGPVVVLVLPNKTSGWLEQSTMDVLRNRALTRLEEADRFDRLRILSPVSDELGDMTINVHAKLMIVDADWLRIGSANLSRRSMGLDSECDLLVATRGTTAAADMRARLLAEHLGTDTGRIREVIDADGLLAAVDAFNEGGRRLEPLPFGMDDWDPVLEPLARIADLEKPVERSWQESMEELGSHFSRLDQQLNEALTMPGETATTAADNSAAGTDADGAEENYERADGDMATPRTGWLFLGGILLVLGFWIYWVVQGSNTDLTLQDLLALLRERTSHPLAPILALPAIVAGSLLVAPITGMIALCALLFDPFIASLTSMAGTLIATIVNHRIGGHFAELIASRIPAAVSRRIDKLAQSSDTWSLAGLRLIPIAPFTIVNLAVGVAGVPLRPFLAGTVIAMGPGILLISFSVDRARAALQGEPVFDPWIAGIIVLAGVGLIGLRALRNRAKA